MEVIEPRTSQVEFVLALI